MTNRGLTAHWRALLGRLVLSVIRFPLRNFHQFMECAVAMFRCSTNCLTFIVSVCLWTLILGHSCNSQEPRIGQEWPKIELRVPETTANHRVIADLTDYLPHWTTFSADPEADSGTFVIEQTGIVRLAPGIELDYETRSIYRLIVRASPIELERDPLFDSFAAMLQAEGITAQGMAKLQSQERRFAVRISIEDEPENAGTKPSGSGVVTLESDVGNTVEVLSPAPVVAADTTLPAPAPGTSVAIVPKAAPVLITTPIPLRPNQPIRLHPHTSQSRPAEDGAETIQNDSAPADSEGISRESSLRFRIAAIFVIFGLGYLLKRLQRPDPDPAEEAAFEEKVVDEIEARIAASFTPANAAEPEALVGRTSAKDSHNGNEVDDENECSTEDNYVLDEVGDFEIPAAPTISDPESLVGAEYYNIEEPFIISKDDAELRRIEQLHELQSCLDERNQRIVTLERQMQSLRGKLEQVTAHLALRAGGPISEGITASDLEHPLRSFAEESACGNDLGRMANVGGNGIDGHSHANCSIFPSDQFSEESSAPDSGPRASAAAATLRPELAELFGMQNRLVAAAESHAVDATERSDEESHLDSVATYLDGLLQRSQNTNESEGLISGGGKTHLAVNRAGEKHSPMKRGPAPSYIESWLQDHPHSAAVSEAKSEEVHSQSPPGQPLAPRRPVDVEAARGHMKSLRQVAIQSAQQAVGEIRLRTARNRMTRRALLLTGLSMIAILAVVTDVFRRLSESSLGSTIWALLILTAAELCLRIDSIRRHRREMMARLREGGLLHGAASQHTRDLPATLATPASGPVELSRQLTNSQTTELNR